MSQNISFTVQEGDAGKRLDQVILAGQGMEMTRSRIKNLVEAGLIAVDGIPARKAGLLVEAGMKITITIPEVRKLDLSPVDVGIRIIYEDDALAVLEKPAGISVHPSHTDTGPTVVHGLLHSLKNLSSIGGVERPGIVHRIDKGTSGIIVISKNDQAHLHLAKQFKDHSIIRKYRCLVTGDLSKKGTSGRIETFFGRHQTDRKKMTGKVGSGRIAITNWKVEKTFPVNKNTVFTLVECQLETGRTHQIRVHMSEFGFPIVGDKTYSPKSVSMSNTPPEVKGRILALQSQLLHAYFLEFKHPDTGKMLTFQSEIPDYFKEIIRLIS